MSATPAKPPIDVVLIDDSEVVRLSGDGLERQLFEWIRVGFEPPRCVAAPLPRMLYKGV